MQPELKIESADGDEGYLAPDVVRLGTAENLTAGVLTSAPGDAASIIN